MTELRLTVAPQRNETIILEALGGREDEVGSEVQG